MSNYTIEQYEFLKHKLEQDSFKCVYKDDTYLYRRYIDDDGFLHMDVHRNEVKDENTACLIKVPLGSHFVEIFVATFPFGREEYWEIQDQITWLS